MSSETIRSKENPKKPNISNGKIENYQTVVATTWNGSPRDVNGVPGPFEQALIGAHVADPTKPG